MYQTYRVGAENPYASGYAQDMSWIPGGGVGPEQEELEQLEAEFINNGTEIPDETQGLANNPSYIDDEEWNDTVEHRDSGIRDIIITGTVCLAFSS